MKVRASERDVSALTNRPAPTRSISVGCDEENLKFSRGVATCRSSAEVRRSQSCTLDGSFRFRYRLRCNKVALTPAGQQGRSDLQILWIKNLREWNYK